MREMSVLQLAEYGHMMYDELTHSVAPRNRQNIARWTLSLMKEISDYHEFDLQECESLTKARRKLQDLAHGVTII